MPLAAIAVLGMQAYFRLPAELNLRTDIPTLVVMTLYPGASPPEIESQASGLWYNKSVIGIRGEKNVPPTF